MTAAVRAFPLGPTGHRAGPSEAHAARHGGDLRSVPREHRRIGHRCRDGREAGVFQTPNRHPVLHSPRWPAPTVGGLRAVRFAAVVSAVAQSRTEAGHVESGDVVYDLSDRRVVRM